MSFATPGDADQTLGAPQPPLPPFADMRLRAANQAGTGLAELLEAQHVVLRRQWACSRVGRDGDVASSAVETQRLGDDVEAMPEEPTPNPPALALRLQDQSRDGQRLSARVVEDAHDAPRPQPGHGHGVDLVARFERGEAVAAARDHPIL